MKKILIFSLLLCLLLVSCTYNENTSSKNENINKKIELDSKQLFKNKNARLAFAYALDKNYITDIILKDGSLVANYFVPKNIMYNSENKDFRDKYGNDFIEFNEEKAKEYWKKAKEELNFDTVKLELLTFDQEDRKKIAEYIQSQFMKNLDGVEIKLNIKPLKHKISLALKGEYDIEYTSWIGVYPDAFSFLNCYSKDNIYNFAGYDNLDFNNILNNCQFGEIAKDSDKRFNQLQEAEKIFLNEIPIIPLYQKSVAVLKRDGLKGYEEKPLKYPKLQNVTTNFSTNNKNILRFISHSDISTLDPLKANDRVSGNIISNLYDTLLTLDENNKPIPLACESFEKINNDKTYIFHLRKDAIWSNGTPVTANDFEFSFKKLADLNYGAAFSDLLVASGIKNAKEIIFDKSMNYNELCVKAIDDYTLEVELEYPNILFETLITLNSFAPINEEFYNKHKENYGTTAEDTIFNGPYILDKWDIGYEFTLLKNKNYFNANSILNDGANYRILKDIAAGVNLYENGEVDMCELSGEFIENYMENNDFYTYLDSNLFYLALNIARNR